MSDVAWILLTDALWTLVMLVGIRYGAPIAAHAWKAYEWSETAFPRRHTRRQFGLQRLRSWCMLGVVTIGVVLGAIVIIEDIGQFISHEPAEIETRRIIYRFILIGMMSLLVVGLAADKRTYDLWGR